MDLAVCTIVLVVRLEQVKYALEMQSRSAIVSI